MLFGINNLILTVETEKNYADFWVFVRILLTSSNDALFEI